MELLPDVRERTVTGCSAVGSSRAAGMPDCRRERQEGRIAEEL